MLESLRIRSAPFDKGLVLALAASVGFHVVAAWGYGMWFKFASDVEPSQVISLRFIEERPTSSATADSIRNGAQSAPSKVTPSKKTASALLRAHPPSAQTEAPAPKTLIVQKHPFQRAPSEPPKPEPYPSSAKSLLAAHDSSSGFPPRPRNPLHKEELAPPEGLMPDELNPATPATSSKPFSVAKTDPSGTNDRASRLEEIRRRIQEALVYPRAARRFGWEGTARVRIVLAPDGQLSKATLESSSQIGILDREVLAAVRRAGPYPYVEGPIAIPVVFDLKAP